MGLRQQSWNSSSVFLGFFFSQWEETKWKHWRSKDDCNFFYRNKTKTRCVCCLCASFPSVIIIFHGLLLFQRHQIHKNQLSFNFVFFSLWETPFINLCWNLMQALTNRRTNRATDVKTHFEDFMLFHFSYSNSERPLDVFKTTESPTIGSCADGTWRIVWQICR